MMARDGSYMESEKRPVNDGSDGDIRMATTDLVEPLVSISMLDSASTTTRQPSTSI